MGKTRIYFNNSVKNVNIRLNCGLFSRFINIKLVIHKFMLKCGKRSRNSESHIVRAIRNQPFTEERIVQRYHGIESDVLGQKEGKSLKVRRYKRFMLM